MNILARTTPGPAAGRAATPLAGERQHGTTTHPTTSDAGGRPAWGPSCMRKSHTKPSLTVSRSYHPRPRLNRVNRQKPDTAANHSDDMTATTALLHAATDACVPRARRTVRFAEEVVVLGPRAALHYAARPTPAPDAAALRAAAAAACGGRPQARLLGLLGPSPRAAPSPARPAAPQALAGALQSAGSAGSSYEEDTEAKVARLRSRLEGMWSSLGSGSGSGSSAGSSAGSSPTATRAGCGGGGGACGWLAAAEAGAEVRPEGRCGRCPEITASA